MITKKRLKELTKNKATVYYICGYGVFTFPTANVSYPPNKKEFDYYETREEAEHYLKYGNMMRTETLSLPYELKDGEKIKFIDRERRWCCLFSTHIEGIKQYGIQCGKYGMYGFFTDYPAACAKVKELWEGKNE